MHLLNFVSLHVFHFVIFYVLFLQYQNFDNFKQLYKSKTYERCSTVTFFFLLLNGIVLIYGPTTFTSLICRVLGVIGVLICIIDIFLFVKLRIEHLSKKESQSRALVISDTSPVFNKRPTNEIAQFYIENAIILGGLLFLVSVVLLLFY